MTWLTHNELNVMGFSSLGSNVFVSNKASLYNCSKIAIGDNVRIDDFCVLSAGQGGILLGNHVHIAVYSSLIGAGKIIMSDFSGLSSRVSIYSSNEDYSGSTLTNPTVPNHFRSVSNGDVTIGKHVIVGSGSVVLPGIVLEEGVAIGALSLVNRDCKAFGIYSGIPARLIKERCRDLLELERKLLGRPDQSRR
jgi:acetyltransferase-like isoleucine patch superfamily enzyme